MERQEALDSTSRGWNALRPQDGGLGVFSEGAGRAGTTETANDRPQNTPWGSGRGVPARQHMDIMDCAGHAVNGVLLRADADLSTGRYRRPKLELFRNSNGRCPNAGLAVGHGREGKARRDAIDALRTLVGLNVRWSDGPPHGSGRGIFAGWNLGARLAMPVT